MNSGRLKKIRVTLAFLIFIFTGVLFLDIHGALPQSFFNFILYFQFIPSLLKSINVFYIGSTGFLIVLILTVLFGRIYCSVICPLGILMDIICRVRGKIKTSHRYAYGSPHTILRYIFLMVMIAAFIFGTSLIITLLDPFSNLGRIMTTLIRPLFEYANNAFSLTLEILDNYSIPPVNLTGYALPVVLLTGSFFLFIFCLSIAKGRLYCNMICPVGTFLSFFSKISIFKIKLNDEHCINCKTCVHVCKSSCIDMDGQNIDFSRCVACFNCIDKCPTGALVYRHSYSSNILNDKKVSTSRRKFLTIAGLLPLLWAKSALAVGKIQVTLKNRILVHRKFPVTPPGSQSILHYIQFCTGCNLCVSACPSRVLQPTLTKYGINGLFTPELNMKYGFCQYDCNRCSRICPSGALLPVSLEEKKRIQLGQARFIRDNCIVILQKTDCGACSEVCPTKACTMVLENGLKIPTVNKNICIGCGACEHACPAIPNKAIYVEGNKIHLKAEKPLKKKIKHEYVKQDFPF